MNASDSYPLGDIPQIGIGIGKESITAKEYLQQYIYPDVRLALDQLLGHIQNTGELQSYWKTVEEKNEEARKEARKIEKEKRRLEMGSDYEDESDVDLYSESELYDEDSQEEAEEGEGESEDMIKETASALEETTIVVKQEPFCPLKFLGEIFAKIHQEKEAT